MKIINECKDSLWVKLIGGFLIFIISWICVDISGLVSKIIKLFQLSDDINQYILLLDFLIKLLVCLILLILYMCAYIILNSLGNIIKKRYYALDIVKYIRIHNLKLSRVVIFGYSLSFIEPIRVFLYENSLQNIEVSLIIPTNKYVEDNLTEVKPISTRIEVINGRIKEWEKLKDENRIKKLTIQRYPVLPTEYGILLNDEILFVFYYIWKHENSKYQLVKTPLEKRGMIMLSLKRNKQLFEYYYYKLKTALHE